MLEAGPQDFPYLSRPRRKSPNYRVDDGAKKWEFSSVDLLDSFSGSGLLDINDRAESPITVTKRRG